MHVNYTFCMYELVTVKLAIERTTLQGLIQGLKVYQIHHSPMLAWPDSTLCERKGLF